MTGPERDLGVALQHFRVVVLADEGPVEQRVPVPGYQARVARDAREAVEVVNVGLRAHHELGRRDALSACAARARRPEQSENEAKRK